MAVPPLPRLAEPRTAGTRTRARRFARPIHPADAGKHRVRAKAAPRWPVRPSNSAAVEQPTRRIVKQDVARREHSESPRQRPTVVVPEREALHVLQLAIDTRATRAVDHGGSQNHRMAERGRGSDQ